MIIRSLRSISQTYHRADNVIFEEPESPIVFETQGEGNVCVEDVSVKNIVLSASLQPVNFHSEAILEHVSTFSNDSWRMRFDNAKIDLQSEVQWHSCCSGVVVKFENSGMIVTDNEKKIFTGKCCDDFELIFDDSIYVKQFVMPQSVRETILKDGIQIPEGVAARKIYPYGGFYEYGVHPKRMESCVCYVPDLSRPVIKIVPASKVRNVEQTFRLSNGQYFVGTKICQSLYDDIMKGGCKIILKYKNEYKFISNAVFFYENTNLIKINFVQQQGEENE